MTTCALCCEESRAWAVGPCDHATCLVCSVRLRVLCEQRECPVCRVKLNKVVVTDSIKTFALLPRGSKVDRKYGLLFENTQLYDKYKSLQQYRCSKCRDKPVFGNFSLLRDHSRKTHGLYYCDICSDNLKLFPYELRQYTRQELTRHRREGDPDDKSYKGHPLCQFCDERFFDNDSLHAHLRKVHFWCHICESDGKQDYYCNYLLLRNHFRLEHFLCEEGPCQQEKFTSVFRNKLDLQVHRAAVHSKGISKAEAKQMRQLDVGFVYGRAEEPRAGGVVNTIHSGRSQWQSGRKSKGRESKENEQVSVMMGSVQSAPQQQHEGKSPQSSRRYTRPPTTVSITASAGVDNRPKYEHPPRLKQRQERKNEAEDRPEVVGKDQNNVDSRSNTNSVAATLADTSQVKKPPGFETSQPNATVNSDVTNEWPDLLALSVAVEAPKQPTKVVTSSTRMLSQRPAIKYNPLEPSNFPPLSSTSNNSNLTWLGQSSANNTDNYTANLGSSIPPGFVTPQWQEIQQDSIYRSVSSNPTYTATASGMVPPQSSKNKEESVVSQVREALNYDREKFNHFRNLSGWYRNSEITVQEYVLRCRQLFGEGKWMMVGPQLAQVMPIEGKRNELVQNILPASNYFLSSAFPQLTGTATTLHVSQSDPALYNRQGRWREGRSVPNWQNECDYPALHSKSATRMTGQLQPLGLPQPWSARVPI